MVTYMLCFTKHRKDMLRETGDVDVVLF